MSDIEFNLEEDVGINNLRELIALVRANKFLYDKNEKLYANVGVKINTWRQIGTNLTIPLEGPDVEKKFFRLRQRFGKEHRKVKQSMPRSGAGADQPTYTPTWALYKDLTFLEDIIKPRKTVSNYKSKPPPTNEMLRNKNSLLPSFISSADQDSNFDITGADDDSTDASENQFVPLIRSPSPSVSESNNAVPEIQKAMSRFGSKRKVPPSDSFASKKRKEIDAVNKSLIEQSEGLKNLAEKIGQAIITPTPPSVPSIAHNTSPCIQAMLSAISFAIDTIPQHNQLDCLIAILQYINDFPKNEERE